MDIFGEGETQLMASLKSKLMMNNKKTSSMQRAAYDRDVCSIERKADLNVIINTKFVSSDGEAYVHVISECPRDYYVAYITRKAWPLLASFNKKIIYFSEAGETTLNPGIIKKINYLKLFFRAYKQVV